MSKDSGASTTSGEESSPKDAPIIFKGIVKVKRPTPFPIGSQYGALGRWWNKHLNDKNEWVAGKNAQTMGQHSGYDFLTPEGTPIVCGVDGIVIKSGWENEANPKQGFGQRIAIGFEQGGKPYTIFYGHLSEILVPQGEHVKPGHLLGKSGNTGASSGPHCHAEVRDGRGASVPVEWT